MCTRIAASWTGVGDGLVQAARETGCCPSEHCIPCPLLETKSISRAGPASGVQSLTSSGRLSRLSSIQGSKGLHIPAMFVTVCRA
jgi:hypothetical protein